MRNNPGQAGADLGILRGGGGVLGRNSSSVCVCVCVWGGGLGSRSAGFSYTDKQQQQQKLWGGGGVNPLPLDPPLSSGVRRNVLGLQSHVQRLASVHLTSWHKFVIKLSQCTFTSRHTVKKVFTSIRDQPARIQPPPPPPPHFSWRKTMKIIKQVNKGGHLRWVPC